MKKVIVITGASSGFGALTARALAKAVVAREKAIQAHNKQMRIRFSAQQAPTEENRHEIQNTWEYWATSITPFPRDDDVCGTRLL